MGKRVSRNLFSAQWKWKWIRTGDSIHKDNKASLAGLIFHYTISRRDRGVGRSPQNREAWKANCLHLYYLSWARTPRPAAKPNWSHEAHVHYPRGKHCGVRGGAVTCLAVAFTLAVGVRYPQWNESALRRFRCASLNHLVRLGVCLFWVNYTKHSNFASANLSRDPN